MAKTYKLRYFNLTARAEPIRLLLSYGNIPFEDERIAFEDWPKVKPTTPLGQLPVLEVDGKAIPQSNAIARYVASVVNLNGNNVHENLHIDIVVDTLQDLQKLAFESIYERDAARKEDNLKKFKETLPILLGKLEEFAKKNGYTALDRLSWADIIFICVYELVRGIDNNAFNAYPSLEEAKKKVLAVKGINDWIKKRPEVPGYDLKQDI